MSSSLGAYIDGFVQAHHYEEFTTQAAFERFSAQIRPQLRSDPATVSRLTCYAGAPSDVPAHAPAPTGIRVFYPNTFAALGPKPGEQVTIEEWRLKNTAIALQTEDGNAYRFLGWRVAAKEAARGKEHNYWFMLIPDRLLHYYHPSCAEIRRIIGDSEFKREMANPGGCAWNYGYPWDIRYVMKAMAQKKKKKKKVPKKTKVLDDVAAAAAATPQPPMVKEDAPASAASPQDVEWHAAVDPAVTNGTATVAYLNDRPPREAVPIPPDVMQSMGLTAATAMGMPSPTKVEDGSESTRLLLGGGSLREWRLANPEIVEAIVHKIRTREPLTPTDLALIDHARRLVGGKDTSTPITTIAFHELQRLRPEVAVHVGDAAARAAFVSLVFGEETQQNGSIEVTEAAVRIVTHAFALLVALVKGANGGGSKV